jgi:hypothetical protein
VHETLSALIVDDLTEHGLDHHIHSRPRADEDTNQTGGPSSDAPEHDRTANYLDNDDERGGIFAVSEGSIASSGDRIPNAWDSVALGGVALRFARADPNYYGVPTDARDSDSDYAPDDLAVDDDGLALAARTSPTIRMKITTRPMLVIATTTAFRITSSPTTARRHRGDLRAARAQWNLQW